MSVNLSQGQKISLEKEAGSRLNKIVMGLGWDAVKSRGLLGFGGTRPATALDAYLIKDVP